MRKCEVPYIFLVGMSDRRTLWFPREDFNHVYSGNLTSHTSYLTFELEPVVLHCW